MAPQDAALGRRAARHRPGGGAGLSRKTRVLSVMDREADCFAVFDEQRRLNRVDVLVRAHDDRCLAPGAPKLFAGIRAGAADGYVEIESDRLSARRKSSGKQARPARTGRVARVEVRHEPDEERALRAYHTRDVRLERSALSS